MYSQRVVPVFPSACRHVVHEKRFFGSGQPCRRRVGARARSFFAAPTERVCDLWTLKPAAWRALRSLALASGSLSILVCWKRRPSYAAATRIARHSCRRKHAHSTSSSWTYLTPLPSIRFGRSCGPTRQCPCSRSSRLPVSMLAAALEWTATLHGTIRA